MGKPHVVGGWGRGRRNAPKAEGPASLPQACPESIEGPRVNGDMYRGVQRGFPFGGGLGVSPRNTFQGGRLGGKASRGGRLGQGKRKRT